MTSPHDAVAWMESQFGIALKHVSGDEYAGACPWCGGEDRFHIWRTKQNFFCRPGPGHCGRSGFLDELTGDGFDKLTDHERRLLRLEAQQRDIERQQREHEARLTALERIHNCTDHIHYHEQMTAQQREWWYRQGIFDEAIDKWGLGWCWRCPTDRDGRASYTIPIMRNGQLENIRHRLTQADGGDKYRPHIAGLGIQLFNADLLDAKPERVVILEGEKKTIVMDQYRFPAVGICGKRSFMRAWLQWFDGVGDIVVALDPDATSSAVKLAQALGQRAKVATIPVKVDDAITEYGASAADIEAFLRLARPVRCV